MQRCKLTLSGVCGWSDEEEESTQYQRTPETLKQEQKAGFSLVSDSSQQVPDTGRLESHKYLVPQNRFMVPTTLSLSAGASASRYLVPDT